MKNKSTPSSYSLDSIIHVLIVSDIKQLTNSTYRFQPRGQQNSRDIKDVRCGTVIYHLLFD